MRGRDNGVPDYNTVRQHYHLPPVTEWGQMNPAMFATRPELLGKISAAYGNRLDNVDLYIGGMLESSGGPGPLFSAIIREQFLRIRSADRFWFENTDNG